MISKKDNMPIINVRFICACLLSELSYCIIFLFWFYVPLHFLDSTARSLSILDVKESPGGVAVGCYTRRVTDRAWTGIQSGGETPEGNAATMVREREFDSPGSDKDES